MSIYLNKNSKVLVQAITGREGSAHTRQMIKDGTQIVAGVTPGKGGQDLDGVPVFNTVREAVRKTGANISLGFVPAPFAKGAAIESLKAGLPTIIISEHVPVLDVLEVHKVATSLGLFAVGPNCPGIITPGESKAGIMPAAIFRPGRIGIVSRSGTLTYEVVNQLSLAGMGQSTAIGIGGDPVNLTNLKEALVLFEEDPATDGVVIIGEIGGVAEETVAEKMIGKQIKKPIVSYFAGRAAPVGKKLGHAGAIIVGDRGTIASKEKAFKKVGMPVAQVPSDVPRLMADLLTKG